MLQSKRAWRPSPLGLAHAPARSTLIVITMRAVAFALLLPLASALVLPSTPMRHRAPVMSAEEPITTTDIDVSAAASQIQDGFEKVESQFEKDKAAKMALVGKGVNADGPWTLPDGRRGIPTAKFDIRWFLFLGLFAAGEEPILEATQPLRDWSIGGVQPFDILISTLAGPIVRSTDPDAMTGVGGLAHLPTGGLFICLAYFAYWKGWTADVTRAIEKRFGGK